MFAFFLVVFLLRNNVYANYVSYDESACGNSKPRLLTDINGNFESPGTPVNYPPNAHCEWKIEAEEGSTIQLEFSIFSLEACSVCLKCDAVTVFDGNSTNSTAVESLCGSRLPSRITSTGRYLYVVFTSDVSHQFEGFRALYNSETACTSSRPRQLTQPSGTITSPFYPNNYPHHSNCHWRIVAPFDHVVFLEFLNFTTEGSGRGCRYDYVSVYDGSDTEPENLLGKFCGRSIPEPLITSLPAMYITFNSDSSVTHSGFEARYEHVNPSGETTTTTTLTTTSASRTTANPDPIEPPTLEISLASVFRAQGNVSTVEPECSNGYAQVFDKKCESVRVYMTNLIQNGQLCSDPSFRLTTHSSSFSVNGLEGRVSVAFVLRGSEPLTVGEHNNCARAISTFAQDHANWGRPLLSQLPGCPFLAFNPERFTDEGKNWSCSTS